MVDTDKRIIYGIVSGGGDVCGGKEETDIFTNVADYIQFIEDELKYDFSEVERQNNNHGGWNIDTMDAFHYEY